MWDPWQAPDDQGKSGGPRDPNAPRPPGGGRNWLVVLAIALGLGVVVLMLSRRFPGALEDNNRLVYILGVAAILVLAGGGVFMVYPRRPLRALRDAGIWLGIGLALLIGYSFWSDVDEVGRRLTGELLPLAGTENADGSISFRADNYGQFHLEADVDGVRVLFMVDTGASDVTLTPEDAERLGFDLRALDYSQVYESANGPVRGAPVRLREIVIGSIRLTDVSASVNEVAMSESLLGASFLRRLSGYAVNDDRLTLRQ